MRTTAFRYHRVVRPEEADDLGHANNVEYLRWILEAAAEHWQSLRARVPAEGVAGVAWVVMRHELEYLAPAFPGDALEVVTWVPTCTRTTCDRLAVVRRPADGKVLARSASTYAVVDGPSGRPRRLDEALRLAIGEPEVVPRARSAWRYPPPPE